MRVFKELFWGFGVILLITGILGILSSSHTKVTITETPLNPTPDVSRELPKSFPQLKANTQDTVQETYLQLQELGVEHPDIVLCQVILETGWFKSNAYHTYNNLLGLGGEGRLKRFSSKRESLEFYKRWQDELYNATSKELYKWKDYYDFLQRLYKDNRSRWLRYAKDPHYVTKLRSIHSRVFEDALRRGNKPKSTRNG